MVTKGGFFRKCDVFFKSPKKNYSEKLSWTWNLNFPPISVYCHWRESKFQVQDSFLGIFLFEIWKTNRTFWKKTTFKNRPRLKLELLRTFRRLRVSHPNALTFLHIKLIFCSVHYSRAKTIWGNMVHTYTYAHLWFPPPCFMK